MPSAGRLRLALDHNFPEPILQCLDEFVIDVELVPIRRIDARMPTLEDRDLLVALHQVGFPGVVTANYKMLRNPRELAALMATKLTMFAIEGVGHDPLRATGALLLDLPGAVRRMDETKPQVFWLRPRNPLPEDPWKIFGRVAERRGEDRHELFDQVRISSEELARPVLA